jgi:Uma2 family endonuclease
MLTLPATLRLTATQFAEVCAANPEAVLELDADGHLVEMTLPVERPAPETRPGCSALAGSAPERSAPEGVRQLGRIPAP